MYYAYLSHMHLHPTDSSLTSSHKTPTPSTGSHTVCVRIPLFLTHTASAIYTIYTLTTSTTARAYPFMLIQYTNRFVLEEITVINLTRVLTYTYANVSVYLQ